MPPTPALHLAGPSDLLAAMPYLLGFHPSHAVVLVAMTGTRLGLVQRLDLPAEEHVSQAVEALVAPLLRESPKSVILVGYEDADGQATPVLDALKKAVRAQRVKVADVLVVRGGRWYSRVCARPSCCPPEGTPLPPYPPVAADFVLAGVNPAGSRKQLASTLEASPGAVTIADGFADDPAGLAAWVTLLTGGPLTPGVVVAAAGALTDVEFRDVVIAAICPGALSVDVLTTRQGDLLAALPEIAAAGATGRLRALCSGLADECAAPACSVLAAYAWHVGDGVVAQVALERALRVDPGYRLALLLSEMVEHRIRVL